MAVIRQFQTSSFIRLWLHGGPRRVLLCGIPLRKTHILQYEVFRGRLAGSMDLGYTTMTRTPWLGISQAYGVLYTCLKYSIRSWVRRT